MKPSWLYIQSFLGSSVNHMYTIIYKQYKNTVERQWLEHLWDHEN